MGRGFPIIIGRSNPPASGGPVYDSDYQQVLNQAVANGATQPTADCKAIHSQLITDLKAAGIWSILDAFWFFANDGSKEFATINWKAPSLNQASLVSSPTFVNKTGILTDGVASYIDFNFQPAVHGVNYTLNDANRGFWMYQAPTLSGVGTGNISNNSDRTTITSSTATRINQGNTNNLNTAVAFAATGLVSIHRTDATNLTLFNNLTSAARTATATALSNNSQVAGRSSGTFGDIGISAFWLGASSVASNTALLNALTTATTGVSALP